MLSIIPYVSSVGKHKMPKKLSNAPLTVTDTKRLIAAETHIRSAQEGGTAHVFYELQKAEEQIRLVREWLLWRTIDSTQN